MPSSTTDTTPQWGARMLADPTHTLFALTAAGAAMDALHIAVCVVDAESRLLYVSPAAEGLLASQQTLRVTDGRLCSRRTPVNDTLRRAIARATRPPRQPSAFSPEPDAPASARLQVRTLPLAAGVRLAQYVDGTRDHGHLALVFVATGAPSPQPHELEQLFGLTRSEAELVGLLARALSPAACAKRRGVSVATVRTQMASVYAKTGVESQTQLLRLVLALPPLR